MLLTITTTQPPATDLGYLLHKNPARTQSFNLAFGQAHVFYPEAREDRCTAALLLDVDPVGLVRGRRGPAGEGGLLAQYVNDRPYVASSFLSVAIAQVLRNALAGTCKERPELAQISLPLVAHLSALPCRGGEAFLRRLFEPLGYEVRASRLALDANFPQWGESPYYSVELEAQTRLSDLLSHLYVLIPVLDDEKHYWVGQDEVEKLLRRGEGWLAGHPEREQIVKRFLKYQLPLAREALAQLIVEESSDPEEAAEVNAAAEDRLEEKISLNQQRIGSVLAVLRQSGARRVVDLGCGEGRLLRAMLADPTFTEICGVDVSYRALERARSRMHFDRLAPRQQQRIRLMQGSLTYRDDRLKDFDAATVVEVIEHLDPARLAAFERVLFGHARPGLVVVTTPNVEYNVKFETLPEGRLRHHDHRFEWRRDEFGDWTERIGARFGYSVRRLPIGPEDEAVGSPTQMGVFTRQ